MQTQTQTQQSTFQPKRLQVIDMTQTKYCEGCKMEHHISEFSDKKSGLLKTHCKKAAGAILTLGRMQREEIRATEYHKECCVCGKTKHFSKFYAHSKSKDGLQSECKICKRKYNKARTQRAKTSKVISPKIEETTPIQAIPIQKPANKIKTEGKTLQVTPEQLQVLLQANDIARTLGVTLELGKK